MSAPSAPPRFASVALVVFDCDGTLVDSRHSIFACMADAMAAQELAAPDPVAVRRVIGLHLDEAVERLLSDADRGRPGLVGRVSESYKAAFRAARLAGRTDDPLFPGIREALDAAEAAGALLGVATGKSRRGLDATLEAHGIRARFVTLQTVDDAPGKPDPTMLRNAMAEAGATPETTVMIGDTTFDVEMAAKAGCAALGVAWGYHEPHELTDAGAAHVAETAFDLAPLLARLDAAAA